MSQQNQQDKGRGIECLVNEGVEITTKNYHGFNIVTLKIDDKTIIGMEERSLLEHIKKHPNMGKTPKEYLLKAAYVLNGGTPYENGLIKDGIFLSGYLSEEYNCYLVFSVHRKF